MSEDKTRIVPRSDAGTISFHCDNGHRINVPAKLGGKRGTCSKCGIAVVIPRSGSVKPGRVAEPASPVAVPAAPETVAPVEAIDVGADVGAGMATPPAPDTFARLFEGVDVAPAAAEEVVIDVTAGVEESVSGGSAVGDVVAGYAPEDIAAPDETVVAENPTAQLVARLWLERGHGGVVELHLSGGSVILPEWYETRWSRGTHGLFASQAADGTVTLTAVAWDSIQKIVVRQVVGLPDGMFE